MLAILLASAIFSPFLLKAQENEVSTRDVQPTFTLQSERNMVLVRVVVRNGKGKAVDNLRQEDFQVFDNGKKQAILQFSVEKTAASVAEKSGPKPGVNSTEKSAEQSIPPATGAASGPPPAFIAPRRFVALYFDDVNTGGGPWARTLDAADRFLQAPFPPGDWVGVFTASRQKPLDFTQDAALVRQTVAGLQPHPLLMFDVECDVYPYQGYAIIEHNDPNAIAAVKGTIATCTGRDGKMGTVASAPPAAIQRDAARALSNAETKSQMALNGLDSLERLMSTLPGQRSIVLVSGGFLTVTKQAALSHIADRAMRANITISSMGVGGLLLGCVDCPRNPLVDPTFWERENEAWVLKGMRTLAQDTGGTYTGGNNDLEAEFRQVTAVPDTAYTLAFSPEELKHNGAFHTIKVTVVPARGFTLQTRKGYFAPEKAQDLAVQEKEDIQDATFSTNEMKGLPVQVNTRFFMLNKTDAEIYVVMHIDLQQVHFRKDGDRNLDNLTLATAVFDRDGHYVTGQQKVLELRLRDQSVEKVLQTGVKIETELNTKAGTYLVRTVVRDSESGQISAVNSTVEIPY
jgi:VWFA-related protein